MGIWQDVHRMRRDHPSPWTVAWSRVKTARSTRVRLYLRMSPAERRRAYPWLYRE